MKAVLNDFSVFRRVMASLCLIAYLQASGTFSVLLAFAADVEGSHQVSISRWNDQMIVRLHHRFCAGVDWSRHWHGAASRLVCAFSSSAQDSLRDHVAAFHGAGPVEQTKAVSNATLAMVHGVSWFSSLAFSSSAAVQFPPLNSEPQFSFLHSLRTTVLLI